MKFYNSNTIRVNGKELKYWKIKNDTNGNPRYLFHYSDLLTEIEEDTLPHDAKLRFDIALARAKKIGGKRYRDKAFDGGIVISSYSLQNDLEFILGDEEVIYDNNEDVDLEFVSIDDIIEIEGVCYGQL